MESIYRNITALDESHRRSLEALLGHQLQGDERIYIAVLPSAPAPDAAQRQQALQGLEQVTGEIEQNLRRQGVTAEEIDAVIDEACNEVRYGARKWGHSDLFEK